MDTHMSTLPRRFPLLPSCYLCSKLSWQFTTCWELKITVLNITAYLCMFLCFLTLHWPRATVRTNTYMGHTDVLYKLHNCIYLYIRQLSRASNCVTLQWSQRMFLYASFKLAHDLCRWKWKKKVHFNHAWNDWLEIFICEVRCTIWCFPDPCWYRTPLTGQQISRVVFPCIITLL